MKTDAPDVPSVAAGMQGEMTSRYAGHGRKK